MGLYLTKTSHNICHFVGENGLTSVAGLSGYMFDNVDRTFIGLAPGPLPYNQHSMKGKQQP